MDKETFAWLAILIAVTVCPPISLLLLIIILFS